MEKDLASQIGDLRELLVEYQCGQNAFNLETERVIGALNRLDDYRGQQIATLDQRLDVLSAALRGSFADPSDVAGRVLKAVDDD